MQCRMRHQNIRELMHNHPPYIRSKYENDLDSVFNGSEASDRTSTPSNSNLTRISVWFNEPEMVDHDSSDAASNAFGASVDSSLARLPANSAARWPAWVVDHHVQMLERELLVTHSQLRRSRHWYSFIFDFMAWLRDNWITIFILFTFVAFLFFVLCGPGMYDCGCLLRVHNIIKDGTPTRK
jgi:hypothetical protein